MTLHEKLKLMAALAKLAVKLCEDIGPAAAEAYEVWRQDHPEAHGFLAEHGTDVLAILRGAGEMVGELLTKAAPAAEGE